MNKEDLIYVPLGGVGHIGMNVSLYHYQDNWIMVDCGAGFADEDMPGIDMIIPDMNFVYKNCTNLLGVVLTHAHEDHCGAIPHIWKKLGCPIYASPFTAAVLRAKFKEFNIPTDVIHEISLNTKFELSPFNLEFVSITHSIPEMSGIVIKTDQGSIFHSGDWKFDSDPVIMPLSNEERLQSLGDEGVMAMVCDSTNVFSEGLAGTEGELHDSLHEIIGSQKGLVAVALFASNVARIETIAKVAAKCGRKIAILGQSLLRIIGAAQESGYLQGIDFIEAEDAKKLPRNQVLLLCTGCQGDRFSATNKLAHGNHRIFELIKGDTIIFSSKIIPGNEKRIYAMLNKFTKMGVEIITEKDHKVHVSGHPYREELKKMYQLIRPHIAIPVHGEHMHLHEHTKLAMDCNVPQALTIADGDVIKFQNNKAEKIDVIETSFFGIDGTVLQAPDNIAMSERRNMRDHGMIIIILIINSHYDLVKLPTVLAPGLFENKKLLNKFAKEIERDLIDLESFNYRSITHAARQTMRDLLRKTRKRPCISIQVEQIR